VKFPLGYCSAGPSGTTSKRRTCGPSGAARTWSCSGAVFSGSTVRAMAPCSPDWAVSTQHTAVRWCRPAARSPARTSARRWADAADPSCSARRVWLRRRQGACRAKREGGG
jgi:hypothetical protein